MTYRDPSSPPSGRATRGGPPLAPTTPREVGVAVVGCGYWGPNLVRNFRSLPNCRVEALCDLNREALDRMRRLYPEVSGVTEFEPILHDPNIEGIAIATPLPSHFELARRCLLAGKHVLVEKPMASSSAECRELRRLARASRSILMVGHTFIYTAAVQAIKELVDAGEVGDILYISAQRLNLGLFQNDINVVWDLAPHDLSIILHILEREPVAVNCQGKAHVRAGIEDVANLSLDFTGGTLAMIHTSWLDPNKVRRMTIVGSRRMVVYDDNEPLEKVKIYDKRVETPPRYDTFGEFQYSYHYGDVRAPYLKQAEPLRTQTEEFLRGIRTGREVKTGGADGERVVGILEAASESLRRGGARVDVGAFTRARAGLAEPVEA